MLVGGLSRGVRGGQTRRPVGSGVSHLLTCYKTQEQHDVYVYVGLCICRSVTPNSGVKSEKHFHLERDMLHGMCRLVWGWLHNQAHVGSMWSFDPSEKVSMW